MSDDTDDQMTWFLHVYLPELRKMLLNEPYDRTILDPKGVLQDNKDATYDAKNEEQW